MTAAAGEHCCCRAAVCWPVKLRLPIYMLMLYRFLRLAVDAGAVLIGMFFYRGLIACAACFRVRPVAVIHILERMSCGRAALSCLAVSVGFPIELSRCGISDNARYYASRICLLACDSAVYCFLMPAAVTYKHNIAFFQVF